MQLSDAAHEYLKNLKRLKLLVNTPSSAELPRNLLRHFLIYVLII